jgi:hypothetical protein
MLELGAEDYIVARLPRQPRRDDVQPFGGVLCDGDFVGAPSDEPGKSAANPVHTFEQEMLIVLAFHASVEIPIDRVANWTGDQASDRNIQIDRACCSWEEPADPEYP